MKKRNISLVGKNAFHLINSKNLSEVQFKITPINHHCKAQESK